ncbi:MAG TPA: hypothetical protein VFT06_15405 [Flavisolibacter sp.]|nr:hypothetical protein [Flavisolibacter sp.]
MFLATSLVLRVASPRFKRYLIFPGCSTLLNSGSRTLHIRHTKDGDRLHFNEYAADGVTYGMVCVRLQHACTLEKAEDILLQFLRRSRKPLHIRYSDLPEIESDGKLLTVTDYWQDSAGIDWKVKGYTNGKIISMLYVKNITDTTVKAHDTYLNGFRFSAGQ